ncbi:MAG: helix-turn-helix transcriptional regulator [Candidatus Sulfotelmatobacter sp.]
MNTWKGNAVFSTNSQPGFLLLDKSLGPVASNQEAIKILSYPNLPERIKRMDQFLADRIRVGLVSRQSSNGLDFVKEFKSGKRRYFCRSFRLETNSKTTPVLAALLLERGCSGIIAVTQIGEEFALTGRERETVQLLVQGLTSKEIATRMKISPNTVKAFLRIVMVKMGVSTRSGILGKVIGPSG